MTENLSSVLVPPYGGHYRHLMGPAGVGLGNTVHHSTCVLCTIYSINRGREVGVNVLCHSEGVNEKPDCVYVQYIIQF
jgi:hypothetical protein